jgi:hypothetical protein
MLPTIAIVLGISFLLHLSFVSALLPETRTDFFLSLEEIPANEKIYIIVYDNKTGLITGWDLIEYSNNTFGVIGKSTDGAVISRSLNTNIKHTLNQTFSEGILQICLLDKDFQARDCIEDKVDENGSIANSLFYGTNK